MEANRKACQDRGNVIISPHVWYKPGWLPHFAPAEVSMSIAHCPFQVTEDRAESLDKFFFSSCLSPPKGAWLPLSIKVVSSLWYFSNDSRYTNLGDDQISFELSCHLATELQSYTSLSVQTSIQWMIGRLINPLNFWLQTTSVQTFETRLFLLLPCLWHRHLLVWSIFF